MANDLTRKRRQQRERAMFKRHALSYFQNLSDDIAGKLMDMPHPKLDGKFVDNDPDFPHSMFTYVWWLCSKGYELKARRIVDALPS